MPLAFTQEDFLVLDRIHRQRISTSCGTIRKYLQNIVIIFFYPSRFVVFAGTELELMKTVYVRRAEK